MDSDRVLRSRKRYSRKSQRFRELAYCQWSKASPEIARSRENYEGPTENTEERINDEILQSNVDTATESTEETREEMDDEISQSNTDVAENNESLEDGMARNDGVGEISVSIIESLCSDNQVFTQLADSVTSTDSILASGTETETVSSSSEYCPTPLKKAYVSPVDLGNSIFLCQMTQLQQFIDQINDITVCYTQHCIGKLVPTNVRSVGLGGCAVVNFHVVSVVSE